MKRESFDNLILPFTKEHGLSASFEEFTEYIGTFAGDNAGELSEDELSQVAGGKGVGIGAINCEYVGLGGGYAVSEDGGGVCFLVGVGKGVETCMYYGWGSLDE